MTKKKVKFKIVVPFLMKNKGNKLVIKKINLNDHKYISFGIEIEIIIASNIYM